MNVLVTGGAGYIGSHMVRALLRAGHTVVVLDDLSAGHREAVAPEAVFVEARVEDRETVSRVCKEHGVQAIFHFASRIQVGESVIHPRLYWRDNLAAGVHLLEAALDARVGRFIQSSTAAVYGNPVKVPLDEDHPTAPINPYGETKLAMERMLASYARAYDMKYVALRYFNAAGADAEAGLGERHSPETHLVPLVLDAALGQLPAVTVFGDDYKTPDGTCIRDYVHVSDLADAHLLALGYLEAGGESAAFNLGTGTGHSVREVIDMARKVSGKDVKVVMGSRRAGDPPRLVASPDRAIRTLGWKPTRSSLERIVKDAWAARSR